jgi:hypothetical protein
LQDADISFQNAFNLFSTLKSAIVRQDAQKEVASQIGWTEFLIPPLQQQIDSILRSIIQSRLSVKKLNEDNNQQAILDFKYSSVCASLATKSV